MESIRTDISDFILNNVEGHPKNIAAFVAKKFNISRQRAHALVAREVKKGKIIKTGNTRATKYFLVGGKHIDFSFKIKPNLAEDRIWVNYIKPMILGYPDNIYKICNYAFTEILNNAIDHSEGTVVYIEIDITDKDIKMSIMDNGVGIFRKIQNALGLESERESILHLSKGKFTTDPTRHTGQGIFFSSRGCDSFSISSSDLYYTFRNEDWFLSSEKEVNFGQGTIIQMIVSLSSTKKLKEIMDQYADMEIGFGKTIVAVALSTDPKDPHVSRSQAKRLLMGLDKFNTIILDFNGVETIGQAFVDEIFRVFQNEHPHVKFYAINGNEEVNEMIERGKAQESFN